MFRPKNLFTEILTLIVLLILFIGLTSLGNYFVTQEKIQKEEAERIEQAQAEVAETTAEPTGTIIEPVVEVESEEVDLLTYTAELEGQTAFEFLQEVAEVEYTEYDFGIFVESINGRANDDSNFWALYINGEKSQVGADQAILTEGDVVEWRYEEFVQ